MRKVSFYKLLSLGILISMIVSCSERDEDLPVKNSNSKITETEKIEKKTLAKKVIDSIQTNGATNGTIQNQSSQEEKVVDPTKPDRPW